MVLPAHRDFPGDSRSPAAARAFVLDRLRDTLPEHSGVDSSDVVLAASELVTNSVRAGAVAVTVVVRVDGAGVELQVEDDADGWPVARDVDWSVQSGRGLAIVDAVADSWDTVRVSGGGKRVVARWAHRSRATCGSA